MNETGLKLSINSEKISNLVTYGLALKNLPSHYKFVKNHNHNKMIKNNIEVSPYLYLKKMLSKNPNIKNETAIVRETSITYNELIKNAEKISAFLNHLGTNIGENISICSASSIEGIVAFFGMNATGAVNARVFNGCKEEKMTNSINNLGSKTIFIDSLNIEVFSSICENTPIENVILMDKCDDKFINIIKEKGINVFEWQEVLENNYAFDVKNVSKDNIASILYTSGSSGDPKPVSISNKVYTNMVEIVSKTTNIKNADAESVLGVVSHEYPYAAINSTIMILLMGKKLVLQRSDKTEGEMLEEETINKIQAIPNYYQKVSEDDKNFENLKDCDFVVTGGETFSKSKKIELLKKFQEHNLTPLLIDGFGFSEMGSATALKFGLSPYFLLMNGIEAKAIDPETHKDLDVDEEGILCISGPTIADNYYHKEEATAAAFVTDENGKKWFVSDTYGSVHGKFKRLIKLGGRIREYFITQDSNNNFVKVYAGHVENVILALDCVEDCIVVPNNSSIPNPVAYISLKNDCELSHEEIIDLLKDRCSQLEDFAQPIDYHFEEKIKRTDADKKDYSHYKEEEILRDENTDSYHK